jgi:hypothetical protein
MGVSSSHITQSGVATQHDDNEKDICTEGDVCDILVVDYQGNEFVRLLA